MNTMPNINIERAVLSAVIFNPEVLESLTLKITDFFYPFHQNLFSTFKVLEANENPIDEEYIKIQMMSDKTFKEQDFLDILSANPISNINAYTKTIKDATNNAKYEQALKNIAGNGRLSHKEKSEAIKDATNKFENISIITEATTLEELINEDIPIRPKYETGIKFLDDVFGGFELGQLVTVTGQQETGKTQLLNQILLNVATGHKALTFSLEFNRAKLQSYMLKKKQYNLSNIYAITQEKVSGSIDEICQQIQYNYRKNDTKFVAIDSQIMLFDDSKEFTTSENEITNFYRKLHNMANTLDIIIFIIATKSLSNTTNKGRGIEIFGSKKASHFADIQLDLSFQDENRDSENTARNLWVGKNKQNGIHTTIELDFNKTMLEFVEKGKGYEVTYVEEVSHTKEKVKKDTSWNKALDITLEKKSEATEEEIKLKKKLEKRFDFGE